VWRLRDGDGHGDLGQRRAGIRRGVVSVVWWCRQEVAGKGGLPFLQSQQRKKKRNKTKIK
jgi:hypothetical protein